MGIVEKEEGVFSFKIKYIPVVDSKKNMNLLFLINIDELKEYCEKYIGPIGEDGVITKSDQNQELQLVRFRHKKKGTNHLLYENLI